jgi:glycosyltransferase involved in cell wall biosynthesis
MRIAFLSWRDLANDLAGGSEIFIDRLAVELMGMGHEVAHLCGGPVAERPYPVIDLGGTFAQYARAPLAHHRTVRDWDLLVDTENGLPYFSPLWRRKPILALVHHVHRDQWDQRFSPALAAVGRFTEARIMPLAYRGVPFVANSPSTASALEGIGVDPGLISIVHPGVDPPAVTGVGRSEEPLFVCAGRLMPHKRVDLLLRAWDRVQPVVGGRLVVIGDGPERSSLEAVAGIGVEFVGRVDEKEKWLLLGQAWGLVHTAQHEGWGIVITEAALVGTPSIGFDVPGVRDAIVDGETGILVDSEGDLVRRWIELATDRGQRERLSGEARRHGSLFAWNHVARDFAAVADAVVHPDSGS